MYDQSQDSSAGSASPASPARYDSTQLCEEDLKDWRMPSTGQMSVEGALRVTLTKRRPDIVAPSLNDAMNIVSIFKAHGAVASDDPGLLRHDSVRYAFSQIDKVYKSQKMQFGDVFARALQQLVMLPQLLNNAKGPSRLPQSNAAVLVDDGPVDHDELQHQTVIQQADAVIVWENIKLQRVIGGIKVLFPFPTMAKPQVQILVKLIQAVKNAEHVVLESPTGTGKTAAILSGLFSWMFQAHVHASPAVLGDASVSSSPKRFGGTDATGDPQAGSSSSNSSSFSSTPVGSASSQSDVFAKVKARVIYLTRTHAQIKQVMAAIKKSGFRPKSCSVASRLQLCIYRPGKQEADSSDEAELDGPEVQPQTRVMAQCRQLVANVDRARSNARRDAEACCGRITRTGAKRKEPLCPYYVNLGCKNYAIRTALRVLSRDNATWDVEDLIAFGSRPNDPSDSVGCTCDEVEEPQPKKKRDVITEFFQAPSTPEEPAREGGVCPYYTAKALAQVSDFVVCPYPYAIDAHSVVKGNVIPNKVAMLLLTDSKYDNVKHEIMEIINEKTNICGAGGYGSFGNICNTVFVFDEGHNLENVCLEEASCDIAFDVLRSVLRWLLAVRAKVRSLDDIYVGDGADHKGTRKLNAYINNALNRIIAFVQELVEGLNAFVQSRQEGRGGGSSHSAERVFHSWDRYDRAANPLGGSADFIDEFGLDMAKVYIVYCSMLQIRAHMKTLSHHGVKFAEDSMQHLEYMLAIMVLLCHAPECYNVSIVVSGGSRYSLGMWLMNPAAIFSELAEYARSIVIASGTLAPIPAMVASLGPEFERRLRENVISATQTLDKDQLAIYTVTHVDSRPESAVIECNFGNLKSREFLVQLGHAIASLVEVLPGGTLVFFPNRSALVSCVELWKETPFEAASGRKRDVSILERIMLLKNMSFYQEPAEAAQFASLLTELHQRSTFVLFAVFRSHSSEGLNLKLSSLILVGLPFPSIVAPKVDTARRYHKANAETYNWYLRETYRAVNQSIGRCIRTKQDKGVVILLDRRYTRGKAYLSSWIHPYSREQYSVDTVKEDIRWNFRF